MWNYIVLALGWIIRVIYGAVHNYGVAIILFTIVVKALLFPLSLKSQRAMKKQQKIQPIIAELQKKYANDQTKLQQEMAKVYKENNVSMAGGCLPLLIQMPILFALYQVIRMPITYMLQQIPYDKLTDQGIIDKVNWLVGKFAEMGGTPSITDTTMLIKQGQIELSNIAHKVGEMPEWQINFNFLGLDISKNPSAAFSHFTSLADISANLSTILLLLIPIIAVLSAIVQNKISMKQTGQDKLQKDKNDAAAQAQSMNKMMLWMMPVMTGYFAVILPAGLGVYWIASGVIQIVQQLVLNRYFDKKGDDTVVKLPKSKYNNQHGKKRKKH